LKTTKKLISLLGLTLCLSSLNSCGKDVQEKELQNEQQVSSTQNQSAGEVLAVTADGTGKIVRYSLPETDIIRNRDQYRATDLIEIPMNPIYNAKFFKIKNEAEFANRLFVGPKVYVYGGGENGRITIKDNENGTVNLGFNIAVISGLKNRIISPNGTSEINVPDNSLVQHQAQLFDEVRRSFGSDTVLAALPGCPKRIVMNVVGEEYDANVLTQLGADYCEIDRPFNVVIKSISKTKAKDIMERFIYDNQVMVEVLFETRARYQVANLKIHFDKKKIFSDLKASIGFKKGWFKGELDVHIRKVIESQSLNISMHGADSSVTQLIINQAIDKFFAPFRADPNTPDHDKCDSGLCLQLSSTKFEEASDLDVTFAQSENTLTGQHYRTSATLRPTENRVEISGADNEGRGIPRERSVELLQTAQDGDIIEILPTSLYREYREFSNSSQRHDNNVCVRTERRCEDRKAFDPDRPRIDRPICRTVCAETQNQWTQYNDYGLQGSLFRELTDIAGEVPEIINGLAIKADFTEAGINRSVTCPINLFERVANGNAIQLRFQNVEGCDIFSKKRNLPSIHLVNNINYPITYRSGRTIQRWNGANEDHTQMQVYNPEIFFKGIVTVKSLGFSGLGNTVTRD